MADEKNAHERPAYTVEVRESGQAYVLRAANSKTRPKKFLLYDMEHQATIVANTLNQWAGQEV